MGSPKQAELDKKRKQAKAEQVEEIVSVCQKKLTDKEVEALKEELRKIMKSADFE